MTPPSLARIGQLHVAAWERALREWDRDGQALPPDARWLLQSIAVRSPAVAARCPYLLRAVGREVAAAVTRSAVDRWAGVTTLADGASQPRGSESRVPVPSGPVNVREAARMLDLTPHGVRAACRRGRLTAVRDEQTGGWAIDPGSLDEYGRRRAARQG